MSRFLMASASFAVGFLHAHQQVELALALNHLGSGLTAHCSLDHRVHVVYVQAIFGDFGAVRCHDEAWLAKLTHDGDIGDPGNFGNNALNLACVVFEGRQVASEDLDRQQTLQAGFGFIHRIFGGLGVVKDDAGKDRHLLVDGINQLLLGMNLPRPCDASEYGLRPM